eukprot:403370891
MVSQLYQIEPPQHNQILYVQLQAPQQINVSNVLMKAQPNYENKLNQPLEKTATQSYIKQSMLPKCSYEDQIKFDFTAYRVNNNLAIPLNMPMALQKSNQIVVERNLRFFENNDLFKQSQKCYNDVDSSQNFPVHSSTNQFQSFGRSGFPTKQENNLFSNQMIDNSKYKHTIFTDLKQNDIFQIDHLQQPPQLNSNYDYDQLLLRSEKCQNQLRSKLLNKEKQQFCDETLNNNYDDLLSKSNNYYDNINPTGSELEDPICVIKRLLANYYLKNQHKTPKYKIIQGADYSPDLIHIKNNQLPSEFTEFRVIKFVNPQTKRHTQVLKCDREGCKKIFRKWHNFTDHSRVHTGDKPFKCSECPLAFAQIANLNKHMDIHKNIKRYSCNFCGKRFANNHNLKCHVKKHNL